jgi:hypothetical protein
MILGLVIPVVGSIPRPSLNSSLGPSPRAIKPRRARRACSMPLPIRVAKAVPGYRRLTSVRAAFDLVHKGAAQDRLVPSCRITACGSSICSGYDRRAASGRRKVECRIRNLGWPNEAAAPGLGTGERHQNSIRRSRGVTLTAQPSGCKSSGLQ